MQQRVEIADWHFDLLLRRFIGNIFLEIGVHGVIKVSTSLINISYYIFMSSTIFFYIPKQIYLET